MNLTGWIITISAAIVVSTVFDLIAKFIFGAFRYKERKRDPSYQVCNWYEKIKYWIKNY